MAILKSVTTNKLSVSERIFSDKHYYRHDLRVYMDDNSTGGGYSNYAIAWFSIVTSSKDMIATYNQLQSVLVADQPIPCAIEFNSKILPGCICYSVDGDSLSYDIQIIATKISKIASVNGYAGSFQITDNVVPIA